MCISYDSLVGKTLKGIADATLRCDLLIQNQSGIKEKIIAAHSYGYKTVLVPKENQELCEDETKNMENLSLKIIYVENMNEVLKIALTKDPFIFFFAYIPIKHKPNHQKLYGSTSSAMFQHHIATMIFNTTINSVINDILHNSAQTNNS